MAYHIINRKILSEILEVNAVAHCNLRCRSCSHLSPVLAKNFVRPEDIYRDLFILAKHYHASCLRILGGEPLLHPELGKVIDAVQNSGIADKICIVTNGTLPDLITDKLLQKVDKIEISHYPGKEMDENDLTSLLERCSQFLCDLKVTKYLSFRETYAEKGTQDIQLIQQVYDTCLIAHQWACHNVQDGFFYKCPQAHVLRHTTNPQTESDGVQLTDNPELFESITSYLISSQPLKACKTCLGSVGKLFKHEQVDRKTWRGFQNKSVEELLDYDFMWELENINKDAYNDCYEVLIDYKHFENE